MDFDRLPQGEPRRTAFVLAHPAHELRLHHLMERTRPVVHVLTDGSGREGRSRLASTEQVLQRAGAAPGSVFGAASDRQIYGWALAGEHDFLLDLTLRLADSLTADSINCVVGDAEEGAIMTHDLFRRMRSTAVRLAERRLGRPIEHWEFVVDGVPNQCPEGLRPRQVELRLDEEAWRRKLDAARSYPEVQAFVDANIEQFGLDAFGREYLFPYVEEPWTAAAAEPCEYERHGERLAASGVYPDVVRRDVHLAALFERLAELESRERREAADGEAESPES